MISLKYTAASLGAAGVLAASAVGVASAATPGSSTTTNPNIGTSGISRTTYKQDRQAIVESVLNASQSQLQAAHHGKTFSQLLSKAGLSKEQFHAKVKAELKQKLESQGYTQDQVTIAMQHKEIHHMRHHDKKDTQTQS